MKNSILLNNFPDISHQITTVSDTGKDERKFVTGYDDQRTGKEKKEKVIQSLLLSLLIHDDIYLTFQDFRQVIDYVGFEDSLLLLSIKCLKIIPDQMMSPIVFIKDNGFSFSAIRLVGNEFKKLESRLAKLALGSPNSKQQFLLLTEDSLMKCDHDKLLKMIPHEINTDLQNNVLKEELQLNSDSIKDVSKYDIYKLLRIANITKGLIYQSELGIDTTTVDGYAANYIQSKLRFLSKKVSSESNESFMKILNIKGIPDLSSLYQRRIITMNDIVNIRENFNGNIFRKWYHSLDYDYDQFLHHLTSSKTDSRIKKFIRCLYPNAIGLLSPLAGVASSAFDSYIVDKVLSGWQPNIFLDDILKKELDKKIELYERKTRRESIISKFGNIGRNDPCPCQSGKKYKKCCGR